MTITTALRALLLAWYDAHRRDLPWRRSRDPYAIWLSEIMLQQTTVRTVEPRWQRFLARYPTVGELAAAPLDDVLHEWTGLGYYARARNLHKAANVVVKDFGGRVPDRYELLLALPGMGVYTAAAVASIAFNEAVPVVDANVERVLARVHTVEEEVKSTPAKRRFRELATDFLDAGRPGDFNQAMMELGATICLPRKPRCAECPIRSGCRAAQLGVQHAYPKLPSKPPLEPTREAAVVIREGDRVLLLKRPAEVSFGGMWELPRVRCEEGEEAEQGALRAAKELAGLTIELGAPLLRLRHVVMRRSIELLIFEGKNWSGIIRSPQHEDAAWRTPRQWMDLPKSTTQADVARFLFDGTLPKKHREEADEAEAEQDLFDQG